MCNFYKTMNKLFLELARFTFLSSLFAFIGGFLYVIFVGLFDEKAASQIDFYDVSTYVIVTLLLLLLSVQIINKFESKFSNKEKHEKN